MSSIVVRPLRPFPFVSLYPSKTPILKSEFQELRRLLTPENFKGQGDWKTFKRLNPVVTEEVLAKYCSCLSKTFFLMACDKDNQIRPTPVRFYWTSAFDTGEYNSCSILFEVAMSWNALASIYYHRALDAENYNQLEYARLLMEKAMNIYAGISRMFIAAWKTKRELEVPVECRQDGNSFLIRQCLLRRYLYDLVGHWPSYEKEPMRAETLHKTILLCIHVSHSSREIHKFLSIAATASFGNVNCKTLITQEMADQYMVYDAAAQLFYMCCVLSHYKKISINEFRSNVQLLLRNGNHLIEKYKKYLVVLSNEVKTNPSLEDQRTDKWSFSKLLPFQKSNDNAFLCQTFSLAATKFQAISNSIVSFLNTSHASYEQQQQERLHNPNKILFWNLLDEFIATEMKRILTSDFTIDESTVLSFDDDVYQMQAEQALESQIVPTLLWTDAVKKFIFLL